MKARQQGISTYSSARGLHLAALNDNIFNLVIAQDRNVPHIFELASCSMTNSDDDLDRSSGTRRARNRVRESDDRTRGNRRRSRITFCSATNIHAGTGQTIHALHLSEVAKYPNAETVTQSLFPAVPLSPGTSIIIESTGFPDKGGDWFHAFCNQSQKGENGYRFVFIPWFVSPEYRIAVRPDETLQLSPREKIIVREYGLRPDHIKFRRQKIAEWGDDGGAEDRFDIEYPSQPEDAWKTLEHMAFDYRAMHEAKAHLKAPYRRAEVLPGPKVLTDPGRLEVWEEPVEGTYASESTSRPGAKAGTGASPTSSRERSRTSRLPSGAARSTRWITAASATGSGCTTTRRSSPLRWKESATPPTPSYRNSAIPTFIYGDTGRRPFRCSLPSPVGRRSRTRRLMVAVGKHMLAHRQFIIQSPILWKEMASFCSVFYPGGGETWRAASGSHDDCVMSFLIALVTSEDESFGVDDLEVKPREEKKWIDPSLVDTKGVAGRLAPGDALDQLAEMLKGIE